jgi:hypothetical protein
MWGELAYYLREGEMRVTAARSVNRRAHAIGWNIKDGHIKPLLFGESVPVLGAHADMLDESGTRVTVMRVAALGIFALGARKKTGSVTVLVTGPGGTIKTKVPAKKREAAWLFVNEFNQLYATETETV